MREDESGYEVHNPEIKETLRGTAKRIGSALPDGWGFLLMLYEFGTERHPGSTFYISNGDRKDCVALLRDWLRRQGDDGVVNVSPQDGRAAAEALDTEWHKVLAMLMMKLGMETAEFTVEDVHRLTPDTSVVFGANADPNVLQVRIVSQAEARRLAAEKEAKTRGRQ